jgi:hypothetical protein
MPISVLLLLLPSLTASDFPEDTEVFLVPHTHTDTGWLEDPDVSSKQQYYDEIVSSILNSLLKVLAKGENRRFVWAETYYLRRWYRETDAASRSALKELIKSGQLELVGGGLVQHDEALPSLDMMIRQLERGLDFLSEEFGITQLPVAWQIDPFGHSGLSPALFRQFGFQYFVGNRINQTFKEGLKHTQALEFIWQGSALGPQTDIFTHILPESYNFPFDLNPYLESSCWYEQRSCADHLFALILRQQRFFRHNKLMILYGDDFTYDIRSFTEHFFQRTESLFEEMSVKYGINVHWGTPSAYFASISTTALPTFLGDFFPHMSFQSFQSRYWTGFYSLLPSFKRSIYETAQVLRLADIWGAVAGSERVEDEGLCLSLHHDAITGTCRPHVVKYYRKQLDEVRKSSLSSLSKSISQLLKPSMHPQAHNITSFVLCNSLNWPLDDLISVQSSSPYIEITDPYGGMVAAQSYFSQHTGLYEVLFRARMPGLSLGIYSMREVRSEKCAVRSTRKKAWSLVGTDFTLAFSSIGLLTSLSHNHTLHLHSQRFLSASSDLGGAYTLSPASPSPISLDLLYMDIWTGPLFSVLEVKWSREDSGKPISQRILLPKQDSGGVIWEMWVYAEEGEEVFASFSPSNAPLLATFDAVTWRIRSYRDVEEVEEMGKNFYPISGAVQFGPKIVIIPGYPLGAGFYDGEYYLHLHRSVSEDDGLGLVYAVKDPSQAYHRFTVTLKDQRFKQTYWEGKTRPGLLAIGKEFNLTLKSIKLNEGGKWSAQTPAVRLRLNSSNVYLSSIATSGKSLIIRLITLGNITTDTLWPGVVLGPDLLLSKQPFNSECKMAYLYANETFCIGFNCKPGESQSGDAELRTFRALALQELSEAVGEEQWPDAGWKPGEKEKWVIAEDWSESEQASRWKWWALGISAVLVSGAVLWAVANCIRAKQHRL